MRKYTDSEVIETFLKRAQELRERPFLLSWTGPSLNIKYDQQAGFAATSRPHDEEHFRSFLLALRHFLLNDEPTNINLVFNVAERTLTDEDLKRKLRDAREKWREAQKSSIVTFKIGDRILTPEQVTDAWINGYYKERNGARWSTLLNLPVGAWILEWSGVDWPQALRAFRAWAGIRGQSTMPSGERSLRRRGVDQIVERYSSSGASARAKRRLRGALERILDGLPFDVGTDQLREALLGAMTGDQPTSAQRREAQRYTEGIRDSLTALSEIAALTRDVEGVRTLWDRARRRIRDEEELPAGDLLPEDPIARERIGSFTNRACPALVSALGAVLRASASGKTPR